MRKSPTPKQGSDELPKVVYTNLGKGRPTYKDDCKTPFGVWSEGLIKIDPRQSEYEMLDTLVHEILHEAQPEITEEGIQRISNLISKVLWREGYTKINLSPRK